MSLRPLQTHYSAVSSLYAPYTTSGGGGGGGGASTFVTANVSSLAVSSIASLVPGGEVEIANGLSFPIGADIIFSAGGGAPDINFSASNGTIAGVSTINGVAYPPPGSAAPISTIVSGGATIGSVSVNLVPAGPTLSTGKCYMFNVTLDSASNAVIGAPAVGDHVGFVLPDTSIPYVIDLVQLSTIKAAGQPYGFSFAAPFVAGAGAFTLGAYCNAGATASTFIGASGPGWITPLN